MYDRETLADLLRRAAWAPCAADCRTHADQFEAMAAHALDEITDDISNYTSEAVNEALAGEDI